MRVLLIWILALVTIPSSAQTLLTTFIFVRHAEKANDGSKDPDLTEEGKKRAEGLVALLSKTKIDAIYSTHFKRTENTVQPLATAHALAIQNFDGGKVEETDKILESFKGKTVVICGHSNTTPAMINYLTGHANEFKTFDDSDFGNLVIVSIAQRGKEATVTWLRY